MKGTAQILLCVAGLAFSAGIVCGETYSPPSNPREDINLDSGWRFIRQDVTGAQTNGFDDSSWTLLDLPYTWNNLDGEDGGSNYYRGIGWYRRHYTVGAGEAGQRLFLKFDGANIVADVYVNGTLVGEHRGGFAAFAFDVTTDLNIGSDNVIAVKVSNASVSDVPPLSADFTFFGGIYRDVHLLTTDPVQVSPLDYGSPGVYLKPTSVTSNSANLQITTVVSNANTGSATATVRAIVTDAATNVVAILTNIVTLSGTSVSNVIANTVVSNPHLWDGLHDPYLYRTYIEIYRGTTLIDLVSQPLGFRYFNIDPNNGFFLNGRYYDLHGVCMHQDWLDYGWALNNSQRETNFMFLAEIGATAIRLAHYQHHEYTYQLADRSGIIVWSEIPLVNSTTETTAFYSNAKQQLRELIRQNYNHPSVICWGMYNELSLNVNTGPSNLVNQLVQLEAQEDSTRPSTGATLASNGDANSWYPQLIGFNEYFGWYEDPLNGLAAWADAIHTAHPTNCIGISEYGAGASIYQHSEDPVSKPGTSCVCVHPEEWQNIVHETNWAIMKARPFLWIKVLWNMFNFAVDGRNEGDTPGRNDKGMVTYDRLVRKDAFYFYKANWTTNAMVYITGHTFTNRLTNSITAKVYANCDSVELFLNGISQGSRTSTTNIFTWPVTLAAGSNLVQAVGTKGAEQVNDSLVWFAPIAVTITNPTASTVFLQSANDTLQLSAAVNGSSGLLQTTWTKVSGPGSVTFGSSNNLSTTAHFSSDGIYGLQVMVSNGSSATAGLTVVVNPNVTTTNGLLAWWKMDETNSATAADSSGNGRTATLTSATFTNGYLNNAYRGASASSRASYSAQDSNQVTVVAWARCDTTGGGSFPRIVNSPSYRLMFRFSSSDVNSVGFATEDGTNGDFDSGAGSISLSNWFHVAVSYDRSNLTNLPTFYVNGSKVSTVTLAMPSGTPPSLSGTGYIGNRAALDRSWVGLIDDLRIYSRLLSDAEVQTLAALPPANLAPTVDAGTSQVAVAGVAVMLNGEAEDDGKPNPPATLTTVWSQVSGPGTASFGNVNATNTTCVFNTAGNYTLRLNANDGQVESVSDVAISVISVQQSWANRYGVAADGTDTDGDGESNAEEFLAGFNPTSSAAYVHIISVARSGNDLNIAYLAANGDSSYSGGPSERTNVLEFTTGTANDSYTNNFVSTGQTNILSGGTGVGEVASFVVTNGMTFGPSRYYRIRVLVP